MNTDHTVNTERDLIKQQLDEELQTLQFKGHEQVLKRTHPPSFSARLLAFWNKEIEIPIKPVGAIAAIVLVLVLTIPMPKTEQQPGQSTPEQAHRELIEAGGNMYWKDIYEQAVKKHAN